MDEEFQAKSKEALGELDGAPDKLTSHLWTKEDRLGLELLARMLEVRATFEATMPAALRRELYADRIEQERQKQKELEHKAAS